MVEKISTANAPSLENMGLPISQAIVHDDTIYVAGQVGVDPDTGELVSADVTEQTRQVFENVSAILETAGSSLDDVIKATVFVEDIDDFEDVNEVYREHVTAPYPARSAIEVGALAGEFEVEIEVIAAR